ncbi:MAG TPA: hypothetical protein PLP01_06975, partial [Phycisphaerae bacterium]|nr:hypothetical protein [Phycisphaerae bacterium]
MGGPLASLPTTDTNADHAAGQRGDRTPGQAAMRGRLEVRPHLGRSVEQEDHEKTLQQCRR